MDPSVEGHMEPNSCRPNRHHRRTLRAALLVCCVALGSGCGSEVGEPVDAVETTQSSSTQASTVPESVVPASEQPTSFVPTFRASQDDVLAARNELAGARERWDEANVESYRLVVGLPGYVQFEVDVVDRVVTSEELVELTQGSLSWLGEPAEVPKTVEDLFSVADNLMAKAEASPDVDPNNCTGQFFSVTFDEVLGYPLSWDEFSPCEDGIAFVATVTPR